jgi:hypothetical protein
MLPMGKTDVLKYHIPFQLLTDMASFLKTVSIINLIVEFFEACPDQEISQCELKIDPLPFEMIDKTWTAVAMEAGDFVMRGRFPIFDILPHIVTEATK